MYCALLGTAAAVEYHSAQLGLANLEHALRPWLRSTHFSIRKEKEKDNVMPIYPHVTIQPGGRGDVNSLKAAYFLPTNTGAVPDAGVYSIQERLSGADLQKFQTSEAAFNTGKCQTEG